MPAYVAEAYASFGFMLQVGDGASPETFYTIYGVGDADGPNTSVDEEETTSHSTGTPHKTYIPTLIEDGEIGFPMISKPQHLTQSATSTYGLRYLFNNRIVRNFRTIEPDPSRTAFVFAGFVKDIGKSYPVSGVLRSDVTVRIATAPEEVTNTFVPPALG